MTPDFLQQAMGIPLARAQAWAQPLHEASKYAQLTTADRLCAFLGQIGHETGGLRWIAEIWGPTPQQRRYERDQAAPWPSSHVQARQAAYAPNRLAYTLGNTEPGDGKRYMGRGLIQTTGRHNHGRVRDRLRRALGPDVPDFEESPGLLTSPIWAALSAADYWVDRRLNQPADAGDIETVSRRVNGGTHGLADRLMRTAQARAACLLHGVPK
jgi:putative chitinase